MIRNVSPEINIPGEYRVVLFGNTAGSSREQIARETLKPKIRPLGNNPLTFFEAIKLGSDWLELLGRHDISDVGIIVERINPNAAVPERKRRTTSRVTA